MDNRYICLMFSLNAFATTSSGGTQRGAYWWYSEEYQRGIRGGSYGAYRSLWLTLTYQTIFHIHVLIPSYTIDNTTPPPPLYLFPPKLTLTYLLIET